LRRDQAVVVAEPAEMIVVPANVTAVQLTSVSIKNANVPVKSQVSGVQVTPLPL
jgi:hypothetical protein